jgi:hypothetical protein
MTMQITSLLCLGSLLALPLVARAQETVFTGTSTKSSLVELYTSESCNACPRADAWLGRLKSDPGLWRDLFPVAFHVNYWDDLGWTDRFATPETTQRQRDYAARLGQESLYTPEFVVNGREWRRHHAEEPIPDLDPVKSGTLTARWSDSQAISASYAPSPDAPRQDCTLNVALLGFNVVSNIQSGENGGEKLQHNFLAIGLASTPLTPGKDGALTAGPLKVSTLSGQTPGALIAWVSNADGKILQITGGWLPGTPTASK